MDDWLRGRAGNPRAPDRMIASANKHSHENARSNRAATIFPLAGGCWRRRDRISSNVSNSFTAAESGVCLVHPPVTRMDK
eukprot:307918-Chlamydomonas_euryale.AAC.1